MGTTIYGCSDDSIIVEGGPASGQVDCYGTDDRDQGVLMACSDGTMLEVKYGKNNQGIWEVKLLRKGDLFDRIDLCVDEDADPYSDVAHFKGELKWCYSAREEWALVS